MDYETAKRQLWECNRSERLERFVKMLSPEWTDVQLGELTRDVWTDAERPSQECELWETIWGSPRCAAMTNEERGTLMAMPDHLTIHRGVSDCFGRGRRRHCRGLSWTLDRDKALWFASRYTFVPAVGWLATVTIPKTAVRAYLTDRGESEIIVLPRELPRVRIETVTGR